MGRKRVNKNSPEHFRDLSLEKRVLIYLADRDKGRGRGDPKQTLQNDVTDTVFIFSSSYVHWYFEVLANTVTWSELNEYSSTSNPRISLPAGRKALAGVPPGLGKRYTSLFKRLLVRSEVYLFTEGFRALQGLGGTLVPMLDLWTKLPVSRQESIAAVSLTETGFSRAVAVSDSFGEIRPWQFHEFMVTVPGFLKALRS